MCFRFRDPIKVVPKSRGILYYIYSEHYILYIVSVLNRVYGNLSYQAHTTYVYKYTSPAYYIYIFYYIVCIICFIVLS